MSVRDFLNVVNGNVVIRKDIGISDLAVISSDNYDANLFSNEFLDAEVVSIEPSSTATLIIRIDFSKKGGVICEN